MPMLRSGQSVANLTFRSVSFNFATAISKFDTAVAEAAAGAAGAAAAAGWAGAAVIAGWERPVVRVETRVPRILLGDYLAQSRAMFLANGFHVYKLATILGT